jgi:hypothetical protein
MDSSGFAGTATSGHLVIVDYYPGSIEALASFFVDLRLSP